MKDQRGRVAQACARTYLAAQSSTSTFKPVVSGLPRLLAPHHSVINVRPSGVGCHGNLSDGQILQAWITDLRLQRVGQDDSNHL